MPEKGAHQGSSHLLPDSLLGASQRTHGEYHSQNGGHNAQSRQCIRHGAQRGDGLGSFTVVHFQIDFHHGVDFHGVHPARHRHAQCVAQEMQRVMLLHETSGIC